MMADFLTLRMSSPPPMVSDEIEAALRNLLGEAAAPPGLIITLRRHDEYELLLQRIAELDAQLKEKNHEVHQMSMYAVRYLSAVDELKICKKLLTRAGVDTSFLRTLDRGQ